MFDKGKKWSSQINKGSHNILDMFGLPCEGVDFNTLEECERANALLDEQER